MKPCCCNKQIEEARKKAEAERLANNEAHQMRLAAEQAELKQRLSQAASKGRDEKVGPRTFLLLIACLFIPFLRFPLPSLDCVARGLRSSQKGWEEAEVERVKKRKRKKMRF